MLLSVKFHGNVWLSFTWHHSEIVVLFNRKHAQRPGKRTVTFSSKIFQTTEKGSRYYRVRIQTTPEPSEARGPSDRAIRKGLAWDWCRTFSHHGQSNSSQSSVSDNLCMWKKETVSFHSCLVMPWLHVLDEARPLHSFLADCLCERHLKNSTESRLSLIAFIAHKRRRRRTITRHRRRKADKPSFLCSDPSCSVKSVCFVVLSLSLAFFFVSQTFSNTETSSFRFSLTFQQRLFPRLHPLVTNVTRCRTGKHKALIPETPSVCLTQTSADTKLCQENTF